MFRVIVFLVSLAACRSHAVLPLVAPAQSSALLAAVPVHGYAGHGYGGYGYGGYGHGYGYGGYGHGYGYGGLGGHGYVHGGHGLADHSAHHLLKRSPHIVAPLAHVAPVAVSHQSRFDVHSSPAVVATSVIQPIVAPVLHAAPLLHKSLIPAPFHYGGIYGTGYYGANYGHGHY